jgi:hypothetical protein
MNSEEKWGRRQAKKVTYRPNPDGSPEEGGVVPDSAFNFPGTIGRFVNRPSKSKSYFFLVNDVSGGNFG